MSRIKISAPRKKRSPTNLPAINYNSLAIDIDCSNVGCGEEGPIRSIFFAEFHPTLGPRMRYQAPIKPPNRKDHVDKDFFDAISHYLIPKPELARRHLTLNVNGKKICGYSIIIDDSKYPRNQLMFNMCFVCYPWSRTVICFSFNRILFYVF